MPGVLLLFVFQCRCCYLIIKMRNPRKEFIVFRVIPAEAMTAFCFAVDGIKKTNIIIIQQFAI